MYLLCAIFVYLFPLEHLILLIQQHFNTFFTIHAFSITTHGGARAYSSYLMVKAGHTLGKAGRYIHLSLSVSTIGRMREARGD